MSCSDTGEAHSRAPSPPGPGKFEFADGGTILLDEIGEMPLNLQPKLLRVLQEREFERLGESETVKVDIRVIATTNVSLAAMVGRGQFRPDLYYRLNVIPLSLPALRERQEDIPVLARHFAEKYAAQHGTQCSATSCPIFSSAFNRTPGRGTFANSRISCGAF